ncbi:MAG: DUF6691 family protein [Myxococcota bacterium]
MRRALVPTLAGVLFGVGLVLSGMTQPAKVVGFLDVAGDWDPSLAFVMGGAIAVHFVAYRLRARMQAPASGGAWHLPTRNDVDGRLLAGAALFGAGWGLGGICPGPGITSLVTGSAEVLVFVGAMVGGMALFQVVDRTLSGG